LADISKSVRVKQAEISKYLVLLSELGLVSKYGIFHKIDDSLLEFWLEKVYQKRKNLLVDGIFNRHELFNSQVKSYISGFVAEYEKGMTEYLSELFNSFSNELVQIDGKLLRLPHFTRVEVNSFGEDRKYLAATFRGSTWLVQAYMNIVSENEIVEYIRSAKALSYKISNKVVIPLKGIDENAKLLAKELKISIWDITTLNNILSVYGKNKVIV
jgi:hypothetical protein